MKDSMERVSRALTGLRICPGLAKMTKPVKDRPILQGNSAFGKIDRFPLLRMGYRLARPA
jgi:hypothetical protein